MKVTHLLDEQFNQLIEGGDLGKSARLTLMQILITFVQERFLGVRTGFCEKYLEVVLATITNRKG